MQTFSSRIYSIEYIIRFTCIRTYNYALTMRIWMIKNYKEVKILYKFMTIKRNPSYVALFAYRLYVPLLKHMQKYNYSNYLCITNTGI